MCLPSSSQLISLSSRSKPLLVHTGHHIRNQITFSFLSRSFIASLFLSGFVLQSCCPNNTCGSWWGREGGSESKEDRCQCDLHSTSSSEANKFELLLKKRAEQRVAKAVRGRGQSRPALIPRQRADHVNGAKRTRNFE